MSAKDKEQRTRERVGDLVNALNEAKDAINKAKREGRTKVKVSAKTLWILVATAAVSFGIPIHDAKTGDIIHDPIEDGDRV